MEARVPRMLRLNCYTNYPSSTAYLVQLVIAQSSDPYTLHLALEKH